MARKLKSDKVLFIATLLLVALSVVMVYSASAPMALDRYGKATRFLTTQAMWAVLGPVLVAERTGIIATFRRSQELTRHTRWRIFLLMLVAGIGTNLFHWLLGRLGLFLFDSGSLELAYAMEPAPFLFETLILMLTHAFGLAMTCTLYIALIERHGDGAMAARLAEVFA